MGCHAIWQEEGDRIILFKIFFKNACNKIFQAIHSIGGVCQFKLNVVDSSPFTGVLKPGVTSGLIRIGGAKEFIGDELVPGIGVKFLRTGVSSANFVALNKLTQAQPGSWDMFQSEMYNQISDEVPDVITTVLVERFCQTGHCVTKVGLSNLCNYDQDGNEVADPVFPYKITLKPTDQGFSKDEPADVAAMQEQFANIAPGSVLYTVTAMQSPDDTEGTLIGEMVTDGECVTGSTFGDSKLFFKHQWIEEDIAQRPEWSDAYYEGCYCNAS